jgi:hypothetical protein
VALAAVVACDDATVLPMHGFLDEHPTHLGISRLGYAPPQRFCLLSAIVSVHLGSKSVSSSLQEKCALVRTVPGARLWLASP